MNTKRLIGLMCGAVLLLGACGTKETSEQKKNNTVDEKVYNLVIQQEMPTADLSLTTDTISSAALNNVYEGIYRLNADDEPEPAGASKKAEVSEDGLNYKIKLREDAKWSNGEPVTADDYVFGWQRSIDPKTQSEYAYIMAPVKNAQAIIDGKMKPEDLGIKAVSNYELEITLDQATPYFDFLLAFPTFFPQNRATVEKHGDKYASTSEHAIYNGPFTLVDYEGSGTDTEWNYTKNPEYWDKDNVALDKINVSVVKESATALNLFNDGQADDIILSGELAQQNKDNPAYYVANEARTAYMELNQRDENSKFRNKNLRKAISESIDREALVTILGNGSIASTGLLPKDTASNPTNGKDFAEEAGNLLSYNPEEAKKAWEKAKKELKIDGLEIQFLSADDDATKKVTQFIQNSLEENLPGMKVTPTPVPFSVRLDRESSGDFEMTLGGWGADYLDPSSFTDLFITDSPYNRGNWSNPEYDKLVKDSQITHATDPEARWQDFQNAHKLLIDEVGVIPVYQKAEAHLINPKFKNVVNHAAGSKWDYKWVTISE